MSVLADTTGGDRALNAIVNAARPFFAAAIWGWYDADPNRVLFKKWFITLRLRDLKWLIEEIAGPDPTMTTDPSLEPR